VTCRELADFILAYLDDTLEPRVRAHFERHLALCPTCVRYLQAYEASIAAGRAALDEDEMLVEDAGVPERLVRGILSALQASSARP